ncbi:MAG: peptidase S7 [Halanaerobiaceae bacterium]
MQEIKGISEEIVNDLVERGRKLGQGRPAGTIGFIDQNQVISGRTKIVDGGSSGLPYRQILSPITDKKGLSLLELLNHLPDNAVMVSIKPGKTGIVISTGGINLFDQPVVKVGVKTGKLAGVGVLYPRAEFFRLATESEKIKLKSLGALTMEEEKQALRDSTELHLKYLEISEEIELISANTEVFTLKEKKKQDWCLKDVPQVKSINNDFARKLVEKSISIEQGREVAAMGKITEQGHIIQAGEIVVGGMGYIPSRMLASSYQDISDISLRKAYTEIIPADCMIVHTHPGGTGVMHISDAMAGPGTWGRSIAAIGHSEKAEIKGVNVISPSFELFQLADEKEQLEQEFFRVSTSEKEVELRKRRYEIAQEFTDLCQEIEIC